MKINHTIVACFHCKKVFEQRNDTVKRQYERYNHTCCKNCFGKEPTFRLARKNVMLFSNPFKGKFHTEKTKNHLSKIKIGIPSWNKGTGVGIKNTFYWTPTRKLVLARDKACWKCGYKNNLHVHHIANRIEFPELIRDEDNCIVLCKPCHIEFHSVYGIKGFKPNDTIDWVNKYRSIDTKLITC